MCFIHADFFLKGQKLGEIPTDDKNIQLPIKEDKEDNNDSEEEEENDNDDNDWSNRLRKRVKFT